jgi:hypothetical protein
MPESVAEFLACGRIAVAGVSRDPRQAANLIFRKLVRAGFAAVPLNPKVATLEGVACYPDVAAVPGGVDGVVVATHPRDALELVRSFAEHGVRHVWFHRSFGRGSVDEAAVRECAARGLRCIVGGCPLMYVEPVDVGHRCFRWFLGLGGRVPR